VFENGWERFTPFLAFPPMLRRVIYTTNSIESLNYQLRKIIKNRGHFPNDDAVIKLLWLAICTIEDKRARDRPKKPASAAAPNAKPMGTSSKARPKPTGNKHSPNSPSSTPGRTNPDL
jgi:putative transposase